MRDRSDWILLIDLCALSCIFLVCHDHLHQLENPPSLLTLDFLVFHPTPLGGGFQTWDKSRPPSVVTWLHQGWKMETHREKRILKGNGIGYPRTVGQL